MQFIQFLASLTRLRKFHLVLAYQLNAPTWIPNI